MFKVQETALEVKEEPVIVFEEKNKMGDQCFRAVTFQGQLQGQGLKREATSVVQL